MRSDCVGGGSQWSPETARAILDVCGWFATPCEEHEAVDHYHCEPCYEEKIAELEAVCAAQGSIVFAQNVLTPPLLRVER